VHLKYTRDSKNSTLESIIAPEHHAAARTQVPNTAGELLITGTMLNPNILAPTNRAAAPGMTLQIASWKNSAKRLCSTLLRDEAAGGGSTGVVG
jgi:hypothetical protein